MKMKMKKTSSSSSLQPPQKNQLAWIVMDFYMIDKMSAAQTPRNMCGRQRHPKVTGYAKPLFPDGLHHAGE